MSKVFKLSSNVATASGVADSNFAAMFWKLARKANKTSSEFCLLSWIIYYLFLILKLRINFITHIIIYLVWDKLSQFNWSIYVSAKWNYSVKIAKLCFFLVYFLSLFATEYCSALIWYLYQLVSVLFDISCQFKVYFPRYIN